MGDRRLATRTYSVERFGAFSDGVFAVAATLLVLEIKLPDPPRPGVELPSELYDNIPALIGWFVSFVVLARFWVVHHHVTDALARCSTHTIGLNFAFLGSISLLPFGASLVGTYEFETPWAQVVFSVGLGLSALMLGLFARHVARAEHLRSQTEHDLDWVWLHHGLIVPLVMVTAAATAFFHPVVALMVIMAESVVVVIGRLRASAQSHDGQVKTVGGQ